MARKDTSFDERSLTPDGFFETRRQIEGALHDAAKRGSELDDEPDDVADVVEENLDPKRGPTTHHGLIRRPLRRYLALRKQGMSASNASRALGGVPRVAASDAVTDARVQFSALCMALFYLDQEEAIGAGMLAVWKNAIKRTRTLRRTQGLWHSNLSALNDGIDCIIRMSEGQYATDLPELRQALSYLDVGLDIDALETALAHTTARVCPDAMNVGRGTGGHRTNYSLGRLVFSLRIGRITRLDGVVERRPAYSLEKCANLIIDDTSANAIRGRDQRYELALDRYQELHNALFKDWDDADENSEMEFPPNAT